MTAEITIIIVNWNTKELLRNCLRSIICKDSGIHAKIIVVDNDSKDGSGEMVSSEYPEVTLINSGGNLGFGKANNLGKGHVVGDYVLFLNPDTILMDGAIEKMTNFMESHPAIGALSCKMIYPSGDVQPLGLQWFPSPMTELIKMLFVTKGTSKYLNGFIPYHDPNQSGYVNKLYGGCLLVRSAVLDEVGWFDERFFMYGEDVDLSRRIAEAGWKLYYMSDVAIIHLCGGASKKSESDFSTLMMCDSVSKLMKKYHGNWGEITYKAVIFTGSCARMLILYLMNIITNLLGRDRTQNYDRLMKKYGTMIRWSLNRKKPFIPS